MTYLFLFTIGPVQSFIAQARKTQDLFAGSRILSDLIDFAMKQLPPNTEFIFPEPTITSKPNRFVAIVEIDDMQKLGNNLKEAVEKEFYEGTAFGKLVNDIYDCKDQLKDFLKVYWVAKEFDENGDYYQTQYAAIEQLLGAVKNVRYFNQFAEKGRKCSINGEYNVKFYRKGEKEKSRPDNDLQDKKLFSKEVKIVGFTDTEISQAQLQAGEGLCAVSFLKRVYKSNKGTFPSTAKIALLEDIINTPKPLLAYYESLFNGLYFDEQLFYRENLTPNYFEKQGLDSLIEEKNGHKQIKKDVLDAYSQIEDYLKSKYYAVLAFDADGMGSKLGSATSKKEHQDLSKALGEFAIKAEEYIDNNNFGRTVYAGGDDFLGFLNLNHLFKAMQALRQMFDTEVNKKLPEHLKLTFSAGIAIAHYKMPLSEVLTWARAMEKEAKKIDGIQEVQNKKNAFGIAVLKHSGEIHKTLWKWGYNNKWTTEIALDLINNLLNDNLSRKFINTLTWTFENLMDKEGVVGSTVPKQIIQMEIARLITRQTKQGNMAVLGVDLFNLYDKSVSQSNGTLQNFLNFLHICEFIGRNLKKTTLQPETAE